MSNLDEKKESRLSLDFTCLKGFLTLSEEQQMQ